MKINYIYLIMLFCSAYAFPQVDGFSVDNYTQATIYRLSKLEKDNKLTKIIDLSQVKGSPYENNVFLLGKAFDQLTNKAKAFYLRYNAYNDVIEIKSNLEDKNIGSLIKSSSIYAVIDKKEYHYETYSDNDGVIKGGYFILTAKLKNSELYLKKIKKFRDIQKTEDLLHKDKPASFKDSEKFYIKKGKVLQILSNKKKELFLHFPNKENEMKQFIKKEKIHVKKEKDLIKLFEYYDSLTQRINS